MGTPAGIDEMPNDALITIDELRELKRGETPKATGVRVKGDRINIKLRDVDGVVPESRGKTLRGLEFLGWFPSRPGTPGEEMSIAETSIWYHDPDMRLAFVHAQIDTQESLDLVSAEVPQQAASKGAFNPEKPIIFGFHGWLIEKIQKVLLDPAEVEFEFERWHNGDAPDVEVYEHFGWTFEQYGRWVNSNVYPYDHHDS